MPITFILILYSLCVGGLQMRSMHPLKTLNGVHSFCSFFLQLLFMESLLHLIVQNQSL